MKHLLITCLCFLTTPLFGGVVDDALRQMPLNDKLFIKEFAKTNFKWNQMAHVIYFDNKPMCLATSWIKSPQKQFMHVSWIKGWQSFKKHEHLFPHPNFIFDAQIESEEDGWKTIKLFIINKRSLLKCFNEHFDLFKFVVGESFSFEWFVCELERGAHIFDLIKNDEELLGILLGYGQESAKAFKNQAGQNLNDTYCIIDVPMPARCKLFPVALMGNPASSEVKALILDYERELNIFWNVYKQTDPLKLFLECICGE